MEELLLKDIQTKAKEISRQYGQYEVRRRIPAQGASRGAHGQDGSQVLKMCYFNLTELESDSVRLQPSTELDHKMGSLQTLVNKYAKNQPKNAFAVYIQGKVNNVMEVHKAVKKGTNIFAASQILGVSMHAFQYIQFSEIPFGTLDLNLDEFNYEVQFHRVVQSKIDGKQEDYDGCLALIGLAIEKCEEQLTRVVGRYSQELDAVSKKSLELSRAEMEKIAAKEQTDLTTIQNKCDGDIAEIDSTSESLRRDLESAITDFKEAESAILRKHEELRRKEHKFQPSGANSQSQIEEIERLRNEDTANKAEKPKRENILMETEKAVTKATSELREWRKGITTLKDRVTSSLETLEDMKSTIFFLFIVTLLISVAYEDRKNFLWECSHFPSNCSGRVSLYSTILKWEEFWNWVAQRHRWQKRDSSVQRSLYIVRACAIE